MNMWKDILKGEEVHPSVKGFVDRANQALRSEMIKMKKKVEEMEKVKETKDFKDLPQWSKDEYNYRIHHINKRIDDLIYLTGAKFGSKKGKDALTGREFDLTVGQRLSPSTKKPIGAKRMKRPEDAFSYNPDDSLDLNLMRRFNVEPKVFEEMTEEGKDSLRRVFKLLQGDK